MKSAVPSVTESSIFRTSSGFTQPSRTLLLPVSALTWEISDSSSKGQGLSLEVSPRVSVTFSLNFVSRVFLIGQFDWGMYNVATSLRKTTKGLTSRRGSVAALQHYI